MISDAVSVAAAAGLAGALMSLIMAWVWRRRSVREAARMQRDFESRLAAEILNGRAEYLQSLEALKRDFASLEANMQNTGDLLAGGRLSRSTRAEALRLLRSGVSPETAASTVGVARREMRLLARVSQVLSTP